MTKRTITSDQRLQAFALYTMALQHYAKVREFERGIARIIGNADTTGYNGRVSDAIYMHDPADADDFDEVLKRDGIEVADEPVATSGA